jgi:hypothetical protein
MANPEHVLHQWLLNGQPTKRFTTVAFKWLTHETFYTSGYQIAYPKHVSHQ